MLGSPLRAQMPPQGLVVEGVPDIPPAIRQVTDPYWNVTANAFMGWDPKTGGMLICSFKQEVRQLHLLMSPQGEVRMSTLFPECINAGSFMPKLGDQVVFAADHNGDEFYQLYRLDVASNKTQLLTDGDSRNGDVIYDRTGHSIAFLSTLPEAKYPVLEVMDPRNHDSLHMIMEPDAGNWLLMDWDKNGTHVLACHDRYLNAGYLWSINAVSNETTLLTTTRQTQRAYLAARYTPDDSGLYVVVLGTRYGRFIDYMPLTNTGPARKVPKFTTDIDGMELSPDGTWLAYLTDETDSQKLHIFNTLTGEELPVTLPSAYFARIRWNEDSTQLGFNFGSASTPYQAFSYNVTTHQVQQWTSDQTMSPPENPIKPQLVKIPSFDQLEISGYLYRPDPKKFPGKRPVLVCIHGGPEAEFLPSYLGPFNYYLDQLGVALLYPNVRGSSGFGPDFENLDNGTKREDSVKDIGAFLDWIKMDPQLDANRIGVQGASYGGYMVLATLFHYGNKVRCGSDYVGITDFVTFLRNTKLYRQANRRMEYGDERYPEMNKFLESISPLNHVSEIHDPVMISAGKSDPRVPVTESEQMLKALKAQNDIVWYIMGENEGHGFHRIFDAQYQFAAEALFFQTYLLPEKRLTPLGPESPADSAAGQGAASPSGMD